MNWEEARWLKVPKEEIAQKKIYHGDMTGRFAYFRCVADVPDHAFLHVNITANSRYRLWVNGEPKLSGPCKGDLYRQYYEEVELTEYLVPGKNQFCVQVLYCDPDTAEHQTDERASIYGVIGPKAGHRLAIEGDILDAAGNVITTITTGKADWRVWLEDGFFLKSTEETCFLGAIVEEIDVAESELHWKEKQYDTAGWRKAEAADTVKNTDPLFACGVQPRFHVRKREIPLLYEEKGRFQSCFSRKKGAAEKLLEAGSITVPADGEKELILDVGAVTNGYPGYLFSGGKGTEVEIVYFEKFGGPGADLRRTDYENGAICGLTDHLLLDGKNLRYEPFWVRTFRYICIRIKTADEAVSMALPEFRKTGYPLEIKSGISSADAPWVEQLWKICTRTLGNCMMETYMDCPYYEQLQFAMDTRLEALFTYVATNDSALAKKALIDFHYGMQPDGLTAGKYPSVYVQILSTFSLHYIYMLWEYFVQTGDRETLRLCQGDVDRILDYYDRRIGTDGLVGRLEYWEFVDWHPAWNETAGIPQALSYGPSTVINLMYAYALECGRHIFEAAGRSGIAEEYTIRRKKILDAVSLLCWDEEKKMYREGPDFMQFTCHAQAWAVLNDMTGRKQAREILGNAIADENCLRCSFSTSYEWFRALEKAGMYDQLREFLNNWIRLLELDCTTCPETPEGARSDCHAWSALPMYEMIRTIAGIHPDGTGKRHVTVSPHRMDLSEIHGKAITPYGEIGFQYKWADDGWEYILQIPDGISVTVQPEDGEIHRLEKGGAYSIRSDGYRKIVCK